MYDKSILAKSTGASLGVVAIVGMLFLSTGTAFALPISGIGGFTISAERIEGENLKLYPAGPADGADAENADTYPQAIVELTSTTITDLRLTKTFDLQQYFLGNIGNARLVIEAGNNGTDVTTNGILLKTPKLGADSATFNGLVIDEDNSTSIRDTFEITATTTGQSGDIQEYSGTKQGLDLTAPSGANKGLILENPDIRATYLTTQQITLPNLALEIQWDTNDDGDYIDGDDYGSAST